MGIRRTMERYQVSELPVVAIEPSHGWVHLNLRELWAYRDLLLFLAWRDISVRYKQTLVGSAWAVIQPFFAMIVFSLFFGRLAGIPSDGVPYPIFSYVGLLPWQLFAASLSGVAESVVGNARLLTKVYFPRLIVPMASAVPPLLDFGIAFGVLFVMMLYYRIAPTLNVVWLPVFLLLALVTALGVGLSLAALNVKYRDIRYVLPFLVQLWMFASPVVYPGSLLPSSWRAVYGLNPMVGVIEGFRWALLGTQTAPGAIVLVSAVVALGALILGLVYFRRVEETFADVV